MRRLSSLMQPRVLLILQLEERKAENEALCESHREKIQQLWDRLQAPQEEREAFNEHMVSSKKRNLEAVRLHVNLFLLFTLTVTVGTVDDVLFCFFEILSYKQKFSVWRS